MTTRQELLDAVRSRYKAAARSAKKVILDEFVAVTGYHRKHAIRLLRENEPNEADPIMPRQRIYDEAVRQGLIILWEASDRLCSKRLKPLIPILMEVMIRQGHVQFDADVKTRLLSASAATIDRLLKPTREVARRGRRRSARVASALKQAVPTRTFADWNDPEPGYFEADFVAHCGGSMSGRFVHSFVFTDIASGWTECIPMRMREQSLVVEAISKVRTQLPIPLLGLDTDNDSAFINETLIDYCQSTHIKFTRSRAYKKNDQAWVEQKNGAIVRRMVGYGRLEGVAGVTLLSKLYSSSRLYINYFQPSFKLKSKQREGAKVIKKYYPPKTPYERLLDSDHVSDKAKEQLRQQFAALDPVQLLEEIRHTQKALAAFTSNNAIVIPKENLKEFMKGLSIAWQEGEARPTHRQKQKSPRTWRTRKDPFEFVWQEILAQLERVPDLSAKDLLCQLQVKYPDTFLDAQLRTLQRRVNRWRSEKAHQLVFGNMLTENTLKSFNTTNKVE